MTLDHKGTVQLETERLILRRFELSDAEAMFNNWASDPEVSRYMTWKTHKNIKVTKHVVSDWVQSYENPNPYNWIIILKHENIPIDSIGVDTPDDVTGTADVGYCIGKQWWHQGYTSEALAELIKFFFEDVGLNRIESNHDLRNPNSGKVMLKCGMKYEGCSTHSELDNTANPCDMAHYSIIAEDYFSKKLHEKLQTQREQFCKKSTLRQGSVPRGVPCALRPADSYSLPYLVQ